MRPRVRTVLILPAHLRAARLFPAQRRPGRGVGRDPPGRPLLLLAALVVTGATYAAAGVAVAVPAGAARADPLLERVPHDGYRLCRQRFCCRPGPARSFGRTCWRGAKDLSATAAFATIILERLLDLVTVLLLFACSC